MNRIPALLLGLTLSLAACGAAARGDALSHVGLLIGASFEHCGPDHHCQGPRLSQYLQTLAAPGNWVVVPYGKPGDTPDDFLAIADFIIGVKTDTRTLDDTVEAVIIGTTGTAIGDPAAVIAKIPQLVRQLRPYAHRVFVIEYPDCGPYNAFIATHRDAFPDLPLIDPFDWDGFREDYGASVEAAGAIYVRGVYDQWRTMRDDWHIDGPSSFLAALRLWADILGEYR